MKRLLTVIAVLALAAGACRTGGTEPRVAPTVTVTETVTTAPSPPATDRAERQRLGGEQFGVAWTAEVVRRSGERCLEVRAAGETQRRCGPPVTLDEVHGGHEVVSVVEFRFDGLEITAGLVAEPVARVRIETAPPPEDPGGGAMEEVEPVDAAVGVNAYAEADHDPSPEQPDLPTVRVVALDATGDRIGAVEPDLSAA